MTQQGYTDPQTRADLDRLHHATRMRVLEALPRNGIAETDTQIASRCGLMLGATLMHLRALESIGAVCGRGAWWHRTGGER